MRKAAFFELRADYLGRPFEDGIIRALGDAGFEVDVFAPGAPLDVEYRRAWLQRELLRPSRWRAYDLFLGTADIPMAFAGVLSALARRPCVTAADEIFVGGYEGHALGMWKKLAPWGMRRAAFTILTDLCRTPLQREYARLPADHEFLSYPSCYAFPYAGPSREEARRALGIAPDDFVLSFTGTFTANNGAHWIVRLLDAIPDLRVLVQPAGLTDEVTNAQLARDPRIIHRPERLGWTESMQLTVAADAGIVFYLSPKPQFQLMGVSSQKLCTALWLGMPVIATRQPSFAFIEEYRCGELVSDERELPAAIARILERREEYARGARRAVDEFIRPGEKLRLLAERFRRV
ncbi:MAG TPA: hypothetical protein VNA69_12335 [Thermoanaerobaculia bacterium]|nr:hypothetical protein [Thermoanaerobaculia bacterium]